MSSQRGTLQENQLIQLKTMADSTDFIDSIDS